MLPALTMPPGSVYKSESIILLYVGVNNILLWFFGSWVYVSV